MKLLTLTFTAATLALLSACSGTPSEQEGLASTNTDQRICTKEKKTGSNISRKVCRTPAQVEAEREDAKVLLRRDTI
jgi:hypothetical protein